MKIKMLRNFDEFLRQLLPLDDDGHLAFAGDLREGGAIMLIVAFYQVDLPPAKHQQVEDSTYGQPLFFF